MIHDKVKGEKRNGDPVHTMKAYKGGRGTALFFFNLGTRWW